jgi:stage V sporulation protein SpoVS
MATGSESVNQAVKAISIARQYLSENKLDVSVQPIYRNQEKGAVTFLLSKQSLRKKNEIEEESQQLRVARNSDPNSVAGSIANKVRAGERYVFPFLLPPLSSKRISFFFSRLSSVLSFKPSVPALSPSLFAPSPWLVASWKVMPSICASVLNSFTSSLRKELMSALLSSSPSLLNK